LRTTLLTSEIRNSFCLAGYPFRHSTPCNEGECSLALQIFRLQGLIICGSIVQRRRLPKRSATRLVRTANNFSEPLVRPSHPTLRKSVPAKVSHLSKQLLPGTTGSFSWPNTSIPFLTYDVLSRCSARSIPLNPQTSFADGEGTFSWKKVSAPADFAMNEREIAQKALKGLSKNAERLRFTYPNDRNIAQDALDVACACDVLGSTSQDLWTGPVLKDAVDMVGALASKLEALMRKHRLHLLANHPYSRGFLRLLHICDPSKCPSEVSDELKSIAFMLQFMSADLSITVAEKRPVLPHEDIACFMAAESYDVLPMVWSPQRLAGNHRPETGDNLDPEHDKEQPN
jgi:hypothetical protein